MISEEPGLDEVLEGTDIQVRRVIGIYHKSRNRTIWEIEDHVGRMLIVKRSRPEQLRAGFSAMTLLFQRGFRPPARYLVPEPVALSAEGTVCVQSRAGGSELLHAMRDAPAAAEDLGGAAAEWLGRLHKADIQDIPAGVEPAPALCEDPELAELAGAAWSSVRSAPRDPGPCHGDYHGKHVFIDSDERVTGIDLEKFSVADRTAEVGYFLGQTAAIGWIRFGSFEATESLRDGFLRRYLDVRGLTRLPGLAAHIVLTLLKALEFHRKVKTETADLRAAWIRETSRLLSRDGDPR